MKAVIDRFVEEYAVVLVGDDEVKVDIPLKLLPKSAREGSRLTVIFDVDDKGTQQQEEKITKLLEKLKNKKI
ncbi:MAG: DUF3006 domain-containing protein [Firmicutes bacterium]|nr:DUF3006 domain-containing protein [Bacillota bacterium]